MVNLNLMVVFGPSDDSYFVTYGRKMHYHNMPDSLIKTFTTEADMNPMNVAWLRMHPNGKTWAAMNMYNNNIWYDTSLSPELAAHIKGEQFGLKKASSITWTDDGKGYFVKLRGREGWALDVPDEYPLQVNELRSQIRDFDLGLKTILFGHAGTHVYVFERGFVAHFEGTADDKDHPLFKVFTEFADEGWNLLETSTLSPYNSQHFLLKFQQPGATTIQMRWSLPDAAAEGLQELREIADDPEEKAFLARYEGDVQRSQLFAASMNFAIAANTRTALFGNGY